jgi:hypothetical protein
VTAGSGGCINCRMASKTILNCASYFFSRASSLRAKSALEASIFGKLKHEVFGKTVQVALDGLIQGPWNVVIDSVLSAAGVSAVVASGAL